MLNNAARIEILKNELAVYQLAVRPIEDAIQALPENAIRTAAQYTALLDQLHYAFDMAAMREQEIAFLETQASKPSLINRIIRRK